MNKNEVVEKLKLLSENIGVPLKEFYLTAGGALLFLGLRYSVTDADISVTPKVMDKILSLGFKQNESIYPGVRWVNYDVYDIMDNATPEMERESIYYSSYGISTVSIYELYKLKQTLSQIRNKQKDTDDIMNLTKIISKTQKGRDWLKENTLK